MADATAPYPTPAPPDAPAHTTPEAGARPAAGGEPGRSVVLEAVFRDAPSFLHVLRGPDFVFEFANEAYYRLVGRRDLIGRRAFEALPEAAVGGFPDRLAEVLATGRPFAGRELPMTLARTPGGPPEERLIDLQYLPLADADGRVTRVLGYGTDVTEHVRARRRGEAALGAERAALASANRQLQEQRVELEARRKELATAAAHLAEQTEAADRAGREAEAAEARLRTVFAQAPVSMVVTEGPEHRFTLVNAQAEAFTRRRDLVGRTYAEAYPELADSLVVLLDRAYATGEPIVARERRVAFARPETPGAGQPGAGQPGAGQPGAGQPDAYDELFLDLTFQPLRAAGAGGVPGPVTGILHFAADVTDTVRARAALAASEARQAFLLALSDALRPLDDPAQVQFEAARVLGTHLGAGRVAYFEVEDGPEAGAAAGDDLPGHYVVARDYADAAAGVPSLRGRYPVASFGPRLLAAYRVGRAVVEPDVAADPRLSAEERAAFAAIQIGAYVGAPLVKGGRFVAGLAVHAPGPRAWTAADVALVEETAERTWAAVERARAAAALRASEARFRTVQDASPHGLVLLRPVRAAARDGAEADARVVDLRITEVNSAGARLVGQHPDAMVGRTLLELFPGTRDAGLFDAYVGVLETGVPWEQDIRYVADGLDAGYGLAAVRLGEGPGAELALLYTDATARLRAEAERERLLGEARAARAEADEARGAAEAANQAKSQFLAVMSHELRTPLNAIGGYAELMQLGLHGPVTAEQRQALERIQRSQRHLLGLINGVLNYARVEAGAVHYDVADVPLDEVLATCEALVAPQVRAKGLALALGGCAAGAGGPPLRARADRDKVQQVVLNLLSNAVKFTPPGGRVTLDCAAAGGAAGGSSPGVVRVRVRDTGVGIAPDQLGRVFEPFVQVDARLTRTQEGTGLGLAISRDLARGMGGDLTAESTPGAGSTFTLTLPAA